MVELLLGVNIDHFATIRNARRTMYPDPVYAAFIAEQAGADGITIHLRKDRRHITDRDIRILRDTIQTRMNLEMALTSDMFDIASLIKPNSCCLVPECIGEITTENGLNVISQQEKISTFVKRLSDIGIFVSLFVDPDLQQIQAAFLTTAPCIEINTGFYASNFEKGAEIERERIASAVNFAISLGLQVNAGHGLTYHNVLPLARLNGIRELNIGHSIISRAMIIGLSDSVKEMKVLIQKARR